jgi:superfamily II DNA or RNA helicase
MSSTQVATGWQPPAALKLRQGQRQIVNLLNDPNSRPRQERRLIAVLTTGYGKTLSICCSYAALRHAGVVQRLLIVVPSAEQLGSYLDEIEADMSRIGAPVTGAYRAVSDLSLRLHRRNEAEVFVATVQSLGGTGIATVHDLLSSGRWMLAADEFHRYADENTWGEAIKSLSPVFTVAVSATPDRTDRSAKAIEGKADVEISLAEAVAEGAIRRVVTHVMDYTVDLTMGGEQVPERFSLSTLADALGGSDKLQDLSHMEVKREIRYHSKYISESLLNAVSKLEELNSEHPCQHKMLVFALGVRHAQTICDQIQFIAPQLKADWIGTQSTDREGRQNGKSESDNETVLARFKRGEIQILVQVRKAAEGFNDVRCSVLVFLNMLNESVLLQQAVGRGLRRNYAIPEAMDRCHVYVSHDHPGIEFLKALADELATPEDEAVVDERPGAGGTGGPTIYDIPEFFIVDASFSGEELYFPLGDTTMPQSTALERVRSVVPQLQGQPDDITLQLIRQALGVEPQVMSTSERIEQAKQRVTKAVGTLASNVVRIRADRSGGTFPKSMLGDTCKAIHRRWKSLNSGNGQAAMTMEELERKYGWVQGLNASIRSSADPLQAVIAEAPWLML